MSDSVRPHRQQPTRLPRPWDSPGKNTGVGCHCLLHCMKVKSESEVAQSCLTPSALMDFSLPGSSIHGIFQARVLEWGAIAFSASLAEGLADAEVLRPGWAFACLALKDEAKYPRPERRQVVPGEIWEARRVQNIHPLAIYGELFTQHFLTVFDHRTFL